MRYYKRFKLIISVAMLLFTIGCVRQENKSDESYDLLSSDMWKTDGFAVNDKVLDEQELWVDRYERLEHETVQHNEENEEIYKQSELGVIGDCIYRYSGVIDSLNGEYLRSVIEYTDITSMKTDSMEFTSEQMGKKTDSGYVLSMDVYGDGRYAFKWLGYAIGDSDNATAITDDSLVFIDKNGVAKETELCGLFLENGLDMQEYIDEWKFGNCFCDVYDNIYTISNSAGKLYIFDSEGKLIMKYECQKATYLKTFIRTATGELIWACNDYTKNKTYFIWFDVQNGEVRELAEIKENIKQLYAMIDNELYYENAEGIVRWDIVCGERKLVFGFVENGIQDYYKKQLIFKDDNSKVLRIYADGQYQDWLAYMSDTPVSKEVMVRISDIRDGCYRVALSAGVAERNYPACEYRYETGEDRDDYRTQVMTQMVAGEGPDILYVSRDDMEILYKKGLIADLREYISDNTLNTVMPNALELGNKDGKLVGMAAGVMAYTLMVQDDVWSGDNWTIDDMISLLESGKLSGRMCYEELQRNVLADSAYAIFTLVSDMISGDNFVIDWENMESHFDDERFVKLLKFFSGYDKKQTDVSEEQLRGAVKYVDLSNLSSVGNYKGLKGNEGWHYVGYPTDSGCGSYIMDYGMVVVNARTTSKEAVTAYMESFLGMEVQENFSSDSNYSSFPVLPLLVDDIVYPDEDNGKEKASWHNMNILQFDDGTTSVHEVNEMFKHCAPAVKRYYAINMIVADELNAYISGERTAEETAAIIDDRVQIYLDEIR